MATAPQTSQTAHPVAPVTLPDRMQMAWKDQLKIWHTAKIALRNLTIKSAWINWWTRCSLFEDWTFRYDARFKKDSSSALWDLQSTASWIPDVPGDLTTSPRADQVLTGAWQPSIELTQTITRLPSIARLALYEERIAVHWELDSFNHKSGFCIRLFDFLICSLTFIGPNVVAYIQDEELFIVGMIAATGRVVAWLFNSLAYSHGTFSLVMSVWEIRYFVSLPTAITFCLKFIPAVSRLAGNVWLDVCFVGLTTFLLFGYSIGIRFGKQRQMRKIRRTQLRVPLDAGTKGMLQEYNRYLQTKLDRVLSHREDAGVGLLTAIKIDKIARRIVRIRDILTVYATVAEEKENQEQSRIYGRMEKAPYVVLIIVFRVVEVIAFHDQQMVIIDLIAKTFWVLYLLYPQVKNQYTSPATIKSFATIMCLGTLPYFIMLSFPLLFVDRAYFQSTANQLKIGIPIAVVMQVFANDFAPILIFFYRVAGLRLFVHLFWAAFFYRAA